MIHMSIPKQHWPEVSLINRMPSAVLKYKIPFNVLFPNKPLFAIEPKTFGCVCFVHILPSKKDKLSARALKCVFLGYSRLQKGYVL